MPATPARTATANARAVEAFMATKAEIDTMLDRLAELSADHFDAHPDAINWGHVGTLGFYRDKLREITDSAFGEGDYA